MEIFSYKEICEILKSTVDGGSASMSDLVLLVGQGVAKEVDTLCETSRRVVIFAGWSRKGAYALATARALLQKGFKPEIFLFNIGGSRLCPECEIMRKKLVHDFPKCRLSEIVKSFDTPELDSSCVVVDGIYGAELDRQLPRSFGLLVRAINESGATVVSIEIPSGLFSEWNVNNGVTRDIIHAHVTVAVETPFKSFFMPENQPLVGQWKVLSIGLDEMAKRQVPCTLRLIDMAEARKSLCERPQVCSKADFGDALICAGSYGMMGAAVLAAKGCLRAGVGKLTCYGPRCGCQVMQVAEPCAMYMADSHEMDISKVNPSHEYKAYAIGPGIGTADCTVSAVESFLKMNQAHQRPVVIDADALNCIHRKPLLLNYLPEQSVLTPHAGEFDRIFGDHPTTEARIIRALEIAHYHNIVIVLKGYHTCVVYPDETLSFNASGTPALATPGSGDVLTGVITALMAQGYPSGVAASIGVFIHGLAGELAEGQYGSYGVTASDVATHVAIAIKTILEK